MAAKITVRELITKLTIGGNAGDKLARFGLQVNGIKAALDIMVGAIRIASRATLGLVDDVTQAGDAVAKTSREIGISAKSLQRLTFAAERSGAPLQNLKKGLQNIERNLRDATIAVGKGQSTGFTAALAEVGIRLREFEGLNPEEKLGLIGEALAQVANEGRRVALSQKLVGEEAGPKLASLLSEGTSGIKALGDEAERLGLVMDDKALAASEAFQDSMTNMKSVVKGVKTSLGISLLPIVKRIIDLTKKWTLANGDFIKNKFADAIAALTKLVGFLIDKSEDLLQQFGDLARMSANLVGFILELTQAVGGLGNAIKLAGIAWGVYRTAALAATAGLALTPIGLLGLALAGVAAAFLLIETNADKARRARFRFDSVKSDSEKPVNERQAKIDATAIVKRVRSGGRLGPALRKKLAASSTDQLSKTFSEADRFLTRGVGFDPTAAFGIGGERRVKFGKNRGPERGEAGLLEEFIEQARLDRADIRSARDAEPEQTDLEFVGGLITPGSGGRTFRSFGEGTGKDKKDNLSDLLAEAIKSGQLPESAALLASTQPPIIIPITNNTITVEVDATSTFEGVPGESASEFTDRVEGVFTDLWGRAMSEAVDQLTPRLAR